MTVDEILKLSGDFGPAQLCLLSLFSLVNVFSAFHYFAQTFITLTPVHLCNDFNVNDTVRANDSTSYSDGSEGMEWSDWEFETVTNELDWICKEAWKSVFIQSTFFIGSVTGTLVLGSFSDLYGRIPMLITANLLAVSGNLLTVFLYPNIWSLSIARFVAGAASDTNFFMMYIIVMEYLKPSMRTFGLNFCIGLWYCVGCLIVPWLAILTKNWRTFLVSISIPNLLIPISCFFIPESAQWLLSVGRTEDAMACFKKVADMNRTEIPRDFIERFKRSTNVNNDTTRKGTAGFWSLFRSPRLRRKTCILIFKTVVLSMCYDAISRNVEGLGLNSFKVFTITSASILPACLVILLLQDKVGRKILAVVFLLLTGIFNFAQGIIVLFCNRFIYLAAILALFCRFSVNIAYNSGTQYAAELIPTQVRGQGLAAMHAIGYAATFFSPQILFLGHFWKAGPQVLLGFLSVAGVVFCLFLPETVNEILPATLKDGETFGENQKMWDFIKRKKKTPA